MPSSLKGGQWVSCNAQKERCKSNNDSPLSQDSNKRQDPQRPAAICSFSLAAFDDRLGECSRELDAPLDPSPVELDERQTSEEDENGRREREDALPKSLGQAEGLGERLVKLGGGDAGCVY